MSWVVVEVGISIPTYNHYFEIQKHQSGESCFILNRPNMLGRRPLSVRS